MKSKLLVLAAICSFTLSANAQTEKGNNMIGGNVGFQSANYENLQDKQKTSTLDISPRYGHFFSKNLALGLNLGYNQSKTSNSYQMITMVNGSYTTVEIGSTSKDRGGSVGPFVRYYVDISEKFKFYGQLNAAIGFGKSTITAASGMEETAKYRLYAANISPGLALFPSKKWAIEVGFGLFNYLKQDYKNDDTTVETYSFAFDSFNPSIGVNFHF